MRASIKAASKVLKFAAITSVSAFCFLAANHYYQIEEYTQSLIPKLNLTVFIDKNCEDDAEVCDAIEALGFVTITEYISSEDVYAKAVEKNPFLRDISVPGDSEIFQSYIKASPAELPTEDFLVIARNAVAGVNNVEEIVFNPEHFREYVRSKNILTFYQKLFMIFGIIMLAFLIAQCVLFVIENEANTRKLITNSAAYLLASCAGFLLVWSICLFIQYPLLIDELAAFCIIPLTAAFGIIFKD